MGAPHWRVLRALRDAVGKQALRERDPAPLSKAVSKQIKGDKDARGKRRGSAEN